MATPDRATETAPSPGLFQSVKGYLRAWVDLVRTRLDLFATELEEEQERSKQLLILGAATMLCISFGAVLVTFFVVAVFWDTSYRLAVLGGFAVLYLGAGVVSGMITRQKFRNRPRLLSATLAELRKDYQSLSS